MNLSREELDLLALEDELSRREAVEHFRTFVAEAWHIVEPGVPFVPGMHIDAICDHLQAVADGKIRDLIINVPPRHTKSTLTCVMFPAWVWLRRPDLRFIYGSDSFNLSKRDSIKCRRLIESSWYRKRFEIKWKLASDQNEKMAYENTRTGSRLATSVGASVIGLGGDFLVVDDPSNAMSIYSETHRENVVTWYNEAFSTRANDPKTVARIVIMQRLHEEDLTGHLLEKGGWDHLVLPAEYEPPKPGKEPAPTSIGWMDSRTEPGALLWPERFGHDEIATWKKNLGLLAAAGQLQQLPSAADGDIIKREQIKFYQSKPTDIDEVALFADLSFKDGPTNDFTCIEAWGRKDSRIYLLDQIRGRMSFPKQVNAFKEMISRWPEAMGKYIEEAANGAAIISTLEDQIMGLVPVKPRTSKEARLAAVSPFYEAGNVYYPDPSICPWVEINLMEILGFPNGKHDDTCLAAGTLVATESGDRPIETIQVGDRVWTPWGLREVTWSGQTGIEECVESYGIRGTPNHPVFCKSKSEFNTMDAASMVDRLSWRSLAHWSVLRAWSLTVDPSDSWAGKKGITSANRSRTQGEGALRAFTSRFGKLIMGAKFKKATMFTTSTATSLITLLRTWSAYRVRITTKRLLEGSAQRFNESTWLKSDPKPQTGIDPKQGEPGIASTARRSWLSVSRWISSVLSAVKTSNRRIATPSPAPTPALKRPSTGTKEAVYNLTVQDAHAFYANGVLVGNCDVASMAVMHFGQVAASISRLEALTQ